MIWYVHTPPSVKNFEARPAMANGYKYLPLIASRAARRAVSLSIAGGNGYLLNIGLRFKEVIHQLTATAESAHYIRDAVVALNEIFLQPGYQRLRGGNENLLGIAIAFNPRIEEAFCHRIESGDGIVIYLTPSVEEI